MKEKTLVNRRNTYFLVFTVFILTVLLFCKSAYAENDAPINVIINGKSVNFTDSTGSPFLDENGRTMVPLRVTMEAAGAVVGYDAHNKTAIVVTEHCRIEVPIGTDYLYCNNTKKQNDTTSTTFNGRTYLPIRAVLEAAGFTMEWDGKTRTVNAYTFKVDESTLVPYSTSNPITLIERLLSGDVVYVNGQYYATPDYIKMLVNTQVHYSGDDLNTAIYPQASRFDFAKVQVNDVPKEWVSETDLTKKSISFYCMVVGSDTKKGFFTIGVVSRTLYEMPSLPDDFSTSPITGIYDSIAIKIENGLIMFRQDDLISLGIINEPITDIIGMMR